MLVTWSVPLSWLDSIPLHPVGDARDSQHRGAALLHNVKVKCGFSQKPAQMNCPPGSVENNAGKVSKAHQLQHSSDPTNTLLPSSSSFYFLVFP